MVAAALWGWVAIVKSLAESLWLDELHSVWCASGTAGEVFGRAALGNQLPPYFQLLRWVSQTFGTAGGVADVSQETLWRTPSVVAWLGMVMLCGWVLARLARLSDRPVALLALALIVIDRLQIFYATEARPYALVALANLLAWLATAAWGSRWFAPTSPGDRPLLPIGRWLAWCVLSSLACWLQPTAALSVLAQYVFLFYLWLVTPRADRSIGRLWPVGLAALALSLSLLPALPVLGTVWEHRQRWAAFASGTGPADVFMLLPVAPWVGPLAVGTLLHGLLWLCLGRDRGAGHRPVASRSAPAARTLCRAFAWLACDMPAPLQGVALDAKPTPGQVLRREWWMWLLAWIVPCGLVYLLTACGIAPLMHRRYVFVAAAPFVLWVASSVVCLRGRGLRLGVLVAMIASMLVQQGSIDVLRQGAWPAAVRGEDWRGAVGWMNSQTNSETPIVVYCASNLIEGAGEIPAEQAMREYLTLPLRSIYRVRAASRIVPLANDPASWAGTVAGDAVGQPDEPAWLIVRCSAAGWEQRLRASGLSVGERRDFGGVQVARDVGFKKKP